MAADECISRPLSVIEEYFSSGRINEVPEYFESKKDSISLLTDGAVNGQLVRYIGMVQDQLDTEIYLKQFRIIKKETGDELVLSGMYKDNIELPEGYYIDYDDPSIIHEELYTYYIIPVPGQTSWTLSISGCGQSPAISGSMKRSLEFTEMDTNGDKLMTQASKRHRSTDPVANGNDVAATPILLNNPLPGETRPSCLIKVYHNDENILINSVIEFIGILATDQYSDESADIESAVRSRPGPVMPRLHCVAARPLTHINPLVPLPVNQQNIVVNFKECRDTLLEILTGLCSGDTTVAEYLLLHLISYVNIRTEVLALGKFCLNISKCPKDFPKNLYDVIKELVTKAHYLPLNLFNLNSLQFAPSKDYTDNRLHTGLLQLSNGTHLIIDELCMEEGQLNEVGVANITSLGRLVQWQHVNYDFKYHSQSFNTDIPVLILSEGRSIINADYHVPLVPSTPPPPSFVNELNDDVWNKLRVYLTVCKYVSYTLQPHIQKRLEDDFVSMRRSDPGPRGVTGGVFHSLLSLARYVAISNGNTSLSIEEWEHTKRLYHNTNTRL